MQCIGADGDERADGGEGALIPEASRFVGLTHARLLIFTQSTGSQQVHHRPGGNIKSIINMFLQIKDEIPVDLATALSEHLYIEIPLG